MSVEVVINWLYITFSKTLEKAGSTDMGLYFVDRVSLSCLIDRNNLCNFQLSREYGSC